MDLYGYLVVHLVLIFFKMTQKLGGIKTEKCLFTILEVFFKVYCFYVNDIF